MFMSALTTVFLTLNITLLSVELQTTPPTILTYYIHQTIAYAWKKCNKTRPLQFSVSLYHITFNINYLRIFLNKLIILTI